MNKGPSEQKFEKQPVQERREAAETNGMTGEKQSEFKERFGRGIPREDLEKMAKQPEQEKIFMEARQARQAPLGTAIDWVENQYIKLVPKKMQPGVETALNLVPFYSAVCDVAKGEAAKEQAGMDAVQAIKGKDIKELGTQVANWFKGSAQVEWGKLQGVIDFLTFGGAEVARGAAMEAMKNLKGKDIIEKAGPALAKVGEGIAEKSPKAAKAMGKIGGWLEKTVANRPEATAAVGAWVDEQLEPAIKKLDSTVKIAKSRKEVWKGA
jgi:hypothetical protein